MVFFGGVFRLLPCRDEAKHAVESRLEYIRGDLKKVDNNDQEMQKDMARKEKELMNYQAEAQKEAAAAAATAGGDA